MNMQKNTDGFSLYTEDVSFDFITDLNVTDAGDLYKLTLTGNVPIPLLKDDDRLILPVDEGMAIEVGKQYETSAYNMDDLGGHFCSSVGIMQLIIIERAKQFLLISLKSPLHSSYKAQFINGRYQLSIVCNHENEITYGIFPSLAAACQAYKEIHHIKPVTLAEKMKKLPEIEKLIGGGIFWVWNDNYNEVMYASHDTDVSPAVGDDLCHVADALTGMGIKKAMFGLFFDEDSKYSEDLYKKYGYLSTQYENYNDVLNPELLSIIPNNRYNNCGYTKRRSLDYPQGVQILKGNVMAPAWELRGFDGKMHPQNTLCPVVALEKMKEEVPKILEQYPYYKGRFIDVFGQGISECYHEEHPINLEECIRIKKEFYDFLNSLGLIAGTEDCMDILADNLVYSEGLHSPVYFRIEDAGRRHAELHDEEDTRSLRQKMLTPECRVPLWHLVYHDSVMAFPYWGDSTVANPNAIQEKILFACLFGCPPLYSFTVKNFDKVADAILESYNKITAVHEKVALLPMTDYEVLQDDYTVQRTEFGHTYEVIANFSNQDFLYGETLVPSGDFLFRELA